MVSRSHQHPRRAAKLLALAFAACLVNGCAKIIGIEDLPPLRCELDEHCADQGEGWTCNEQNRCVPPSGADCSTTMMCPLENEPICDSTVDPPTCRACASDEECRAKDDLAPYCSPNGDCTADLPPECFDSGDCDADAAKPICVMDGDGAGSCAGCLDGSHCTADAPVCDPNVRTCGACKEHSDCDLHSGVCGGNGKCVAEADIIYVVKNGTNVDVCSSEMPCGTVGDALALVAGTRRYILLDDQIYPEHLDLEDIDVTIVGNNAALLGTESNPVISIANNVSLSLAGLIVRSAVTSGSVAGISCLSSNSSTVQLRNMVVRDNSGVGVAVNQCTLDVARTKITNNLGGGINVSNAAFSIVNSFIVANGKDTGTAPLSNLGGVRIVNTDVFDPQLFAFNTVAENRAGSSAASAGVQCTVNASSTVVATSSIIRKGLGGKPTLAGDCEWSSSNVEEGAALSALAPTANGNNYDDCSLADDGTGIYRFTAGSPCDNSGQADTGIDVDYEGPARPATPGTAPDMGADEIHQAPSP